MLPSLVCAPAQKWASGLFFAGILVLMSPVFSQESYSGKFTATGSDGNEVCGLAMLQAFITPGEDASDKKIDCTAKGRSWSAYGLLLLLLSIPPASTSLQRPTESAKAG